MSPAITEGSQAPEGVAENTTPSLSTASMQVVSLAISSSSIFVRAISISVGCFPRLPLIKPGKKSIEAMCPISLRRSAA